MSAEPRPERSLDHVTISAVDPGPLITFYDAALGALGLGRVGDLVDEEEEAGAVEVEVVGWGRPDEPAVLWVVRATAPTRGLHVSFRARSRLEVETFFRAGVNAGGQARAEPRPWTLYRPGEFGAMVADPAGNLVEAVCIDRPAG